MSDRPTLALTTDQVVEDGDGFIITMASVWLCPPPHRQVPPPELRALNQPCPTCEGTGDEMGDSGIVLGIPGGQVPIGPCPDCDGSGRLVFDLKTPCTYEWEPGEPCDGTIPDKDGDIAGYCDRCTDGYVTHRVWLDPDSVVLIVDVDDGLPDDRPVATLSPGRIHFWRPGRAGWPHEASISAPAPSAAEVGWVAARLRKVTQ